MKQGNMWSCFNFKIIRPINIFSFQNFLINNGYLSSKIWKFELNSFANIFFLLIWIGGNNFFFSKNTFYEQRVFFMFFLAFDFCRFCVVICFFIPATTANDLRLWRISIPNLIHYILILILEKEPVFPFSMLSAEQGNYWYHFYNVFGMTRSLTRDWTRDLSHAKPALYH